MSKTIPITKVQRLKIESASIKEVGNNVLIHDTETKEVASIPKESFLAGVNKRIDGIVFPDGFTKTGFIGRVGNKITIQPNEFEWKIELNPYTNAILFDETIAATTTPELNRIDSLAATSDNTIVLYPGEEVDENSVAIPPVLPTDVLRLTDIYIYGNDVTETTEPFVSEVFTLAEKEKLAAMDATLKEDKDQKGAAGGYAPLNELTKIAAEYLTYVNDLVTGGATAILSAQQGVVLKAQIDAINTLLTSDNINLDTVQEIVDAIETVQTSLDTILVNDLTTGGTTKALTAEQGKVLKGLYDSLYSNSTIDTLLQGKANYFLAIKPISGLTYNVILTDVLNQLVYDDIVDTNLIIPNDATLNLPIGSVFYSVATNTGLINVTGEAGVIFQTAVGLTGVQNEVRKYTKRAANTWGVEGGVSPAAVVDNFGAKQANTYFINSVTGVDVDGIYEDVSKPYKTIDYVLALPTYKSGDIIQLLDEGTFPINEQFPFNTDVHIKSSLKSTVDFSFNENVKMSVDTTTQAPKIYFDMPFGIIKNERFGSTGCYISIASGNCSVIVNVDTIYWNCSSYFIYLGVTTLDFKVKYIQCSACLLYKVLSKSNNIHIGEFKCLSANASLVYISEVNIYINKISGVNYLFKNTYISVKDITCTNNCRIEDARVHFDNSIITTGIDFTSYFGASVVSGNIISCLTFGMSGISQNGALNVINFTANIGAGKFNPYKGTYTFENCSIKSNGTVFAFNNNGTATLTLKNCSFEMTTPAPLCTASATEVRTIRVSNVMSNATMLSEGVGVTILQDAFLGKNHQFLGYPNTRNDGQLPTNKVLSTDASGNLKMYSIAIAPAPYLLILIPDSTLPSTTTDFVLKGAFFTPTMTVSIVGQTINRITFVSDNEVKVNVTTGATEGSFAVTLNNGISATFNNALLIVLGTVYTPTSSNWVVNNFGDVSTNGTFKLTQFNLTSYGKINTNFIMIPANIDYELRFSFAFSPYDSGTQGDQNYNSFNIKGVADNAVKYSMGVTNTTTGGSVYPYGPDYLGASGTFLDTTIDNFPIKIKRVGGITSFYVNDVYKKTATAEYNLDMYVDIQAKVIDFVNIKYITLGV